MADIEDQLRGLYLRLNRLEDAVLTLSKRGTAHTAASDLPRATPVSVERPSPDRATTVAPAVTYKTPLQSTRPLRVQVPHAELTVTQIMGWTGATLLVLAAAYFIRLVYDAGWLTPSRQLLLAVLGGIGLIVAGLKLQRVDNNYASLLPAGGLVVFFLAIYGAHLYYHLIGAGVAAAAVVCNCLLALWLGRIFASEIYGLFAVVGSYSAPLLLPALSVSTLNLAVYFTVWSLVFCAYAVSIESRRPYLLAGYMALLAFQMSWAHSGADHWVAALVFQTAQFAVFLGAAITFSIQHARPLTPPEGVAHLPLLLLFYGLQYTLLQQHVPSVAPWVAIGSAAVLLLAYALAKYAMKVSLAAGGLIVGSYCALVLFHAVYLELIPDHFTPWAVLLALPLLAVYAMRSNVDAQFLLPFKILVLGLFVINYLRVILQIDHVVAGNPTLVAFLYTVELYAAYFLGRSKDLLRQWVTPILYAAHVGFMGVVLRAFDNALLVSLGWAGLALAALAWAFRSNDQGLGKSSLLIFAGSLIKVLMFDLAGSAPLVRIGSLVVVGISLYAGGMLYKKVIALDEAPSGRDAKAFA